MEQDLSELTKLITAEQTGGLAAMLRLADEFIAAGDVPAARRALERAADGAYDLLYAEYRRPPNSEGSTV